MRALHVVVVIVVAGVASLVGCSYSVDDYRVVDPTVDARVDTTLEDAGSDAAVDVALDGADAEATPCGSLTACGGGCVDISSDSKNCGTCGHSCPSGQCKKGTCK